MGSLAPREELTPDPITEESEPELTLLQPTELWRNQKRPKTASLARLRAD